jgi:hypothetical protein
VDLLKKDEMVAKISQTAQNPHQTRHLVLHSIRVKMIKLAIDKPIK